MDRVAVAVLAHGAGSHGRFLTAAFPASRLGVTATLALDDRTGDVRVIAARLRAVIAAQPGPVVAGGVSLGGHAAALVAAVDPPANLVRAVFALPAWTGAPGAVAAATAASAEALAVRGRGAVLADLDTSDWVTAALARAWRERAHRGELVAELRRAATQPGPTMRQLAAIRVPVAVVALADDPLHPLAVAEAWAAAIPHAALAVVARRAPRDDPAVFADAARDAWAG